MNDISFAVLCVAAAAGGLFVLVVQAVLVWCGERDERQRELKRARLDRVLGGGW